MFSRAFFTSRVAKKYKFKYFFDCGFLSTAQYTEIQVKLSRPLWDSIRVSKTAPQATMCIESA